MRILTIAMLALPLLGQQAGKTDQNLRAHQVGTHQRWILRSSGDRYEVPGKERLEWNGTIYFFARGVKTRSAAAKTYLEFPNQARVEQNGTNLMTFDTDLGLTTHFANFLIANEDNKSEAHGSNQLSRKLRFAKNDPPKPARIAVNGGGGK